MEEHKLFYRTKPVEKTAVGVTVEFDNTGKLTIELGDANLDILFVDQNDVNIICSDLITNLNTIIANPHTPGVDSRLTGCGCFLITSYYNYAGCAGECGGLLITHGLVGVGGGDNIDKMISRLKALSDALLLIKQLFENLS